MCFRLICAASFFSFLALTSSLVFASETGIWRHGLSLFGELKYPDGFSHFDYVNPHAPKGGSMRRSALGTFDTLNPFNLKGTPASGAGLIYDTLMGSASDEPSSEYGLLAEAMRYPDDYSSVTYRLRADALWHDGQPIVVEDVIWSLGVLKSSHPRYRFYYQNIVKAEETGEREVTFYFDETGNRELPQITGQLIILPKHYWEGENAKGERRNFSRSTLEPPLGSGPYRISEVKPGRSIIYQRVDDYWGASLPVNVGQYNFDEISFEYFRDTTVLHEAFKGDVFDFTIENSAKRWATGYTFPAVIGGDVVVEAFRTKNAAPMQAYVFNTRRGKFSDPRVRRAFNLAFDFEWLKSNVFYNQYERIDSYFENSELEAIGLPEGLELDILEPLRGAIPNEVFTKKYTNPVGGNAQKVRANLREAQRLFKEAGWRVKDRKLVHEVTGELMNVEFLIVQPDMERVISPFRKNLQRIGVLSSIRTVDVSQYQERLDTFDFDIVISSFAQSLSPGNEQRDYWGSETADREGSGNLIGIQDEAIDSLINTIIFAKDRNALIASTRALDRVLLWNHFVVPQFFTADIRSARWNRFGLPDIKPDYGISTNSWWHDESLATQIKSGK
jgi:microcin C transport system substrate-binding protein